MCCLLRLAKVHQTTSRFSEIKLSMYVNAGGAFPVLKGKAAELRHLPPALCHAFSTCCTSPRASVEDLMLMLLQSAVKIEAIMDEHSEEYRLPSKAQREFEDAIYLFFQSNTFLGQEFHPKGVGLFNHVVKYHYMLHLAHISRFINPRLGLCYAGEDFMHITKGIAQASQKGTPPALVSKKAMIKYAKGLSLQMHDSVWL